MAQFNLPKNSKPEFSQMVWEKVHEGMKAAIYYNKGTGKTKARMILSTDGSITELNEKSKGLWHNINAKKKSGRKSARKGSKAYKAAVKAGNKLKDSVIYRVLIDRNHEGL